MNHRQVLVHVARHAAHRLAKDFSGQLPQEVDRALADADLGDVEPGYEVPPVRDVGSFLVQCAALGGELVTRRMGDGNGHAGTDGELVHELERLLRARAAAPPGMSDGDVDRAITVIAEDLASMYHRRDVHR